MKNLTAGRILRIVIGALVFAGLMTARDGAPGAIWRILIAGLAGVALGLALEQHRPGRSKIRFVCGVLGFAVLMSVRDAVPGTHWRALTAALAVGCLIAGLVLVPRARARPPHVPRAPANRPS